MPHPQSADPIPHNGKVYRRCVAALVFNTEGEVLVGERVHAPGSWQLPQGGVDAGETEAAAATRELFEEVGLTGLEGLFGTDVPSDACFYDVEAKGSWLVRSGMAGQHLAFVAFHAPGAPAEVLAKAQLAGMGGEKPEFAAVRWTPFAEAVREVWAPKRPAYAAALQALTPKILAHLAKLR